MCVSEPPAAPYRGGARTAAACTMTDTRMLLREGANTGDAEKGAGQENRGPLCARRWGVQTPQEPGRTSAIMRPIASRGAVHVSASVGTPSIVRARTELPWSTAAARIGRWYGALAAICRLR